MSIESKYTKTATVYRLQWLTDEDDFEYSEETELVNTIKGHLQQINQTQTQYTGFNFVLTHAFWCSPNSDIKVGDRLEIDGDFFGVKAIQDNSFIGINKHYEVLLEKQEIGS